MQNGSIRIEPNIGSNANLKKADRAEREREGDGGVKGREASWALQTEIMGRKGDKRGVVLSYQILISGLLSFSLN